MKLLEDLRFSSYQISEEHEPFLRRGFYALLIIWPLAFLGFPLIFQWANKYLDHEQYMGLAILVPQLILGVAVLCVIKSKGRTLEILNLKHWEWRFLGIGIALPFPLLILIGLVSWVWRLTLEYVGISLPEETALELMIKNAGPWLFVHAALLAIIVAPLVEEILFRRIIFGFISIRLGNLCGLLLASSLFAVIHLDWKNLPGLFILGAVFQIVTMCCKSLYPAIIMHSTNNAMAIGLLYALRKGWIEL